MNKAPVTAAPLGVLPCETWLRFRREACEASAYDCIRFISEASAEEICKHQATIDRTSREHEFINTLIGECVECYECGYMTSSTRLPAEARCMNLGWNEVFYAGRNVCDRCVAERMIQKLKHLSKPWYVRLRDDFLDWIGW